MTIQNTGTAAATGVTLTDPIPAGTTYIAGSTTLNAVAIPDVGGTMPFALGGLINDFGDPPGVIGPSRSASLVFQVRWIRPRRPRSPTPRRSTRMGPGALQPFPAAVISPVAAMADVTVAKDGPDRATPGTNAVFTITVTNDGPSVATNVVLADPTPPGLVFVSNSGACTTAFPCALGTLAPGATRTVTTTFSVPSTYTTSRSDRERGERGERHARPGGWQQHRAGVGGSDGAGCQPDDHEDPMARRPPSRATPRPTPSRSATRARAT